MALQVSLIHLSGPFRSLARRNSRLDPFSSPAAFATTQPPTLIGHCRLSPSCPSGLVPSVDVPHPTHWSPRPTPFPRACRADSPLSSPCSSGRCTTARRCSWRASPTHLCFPPGCSPLASGERCYLKGSGQAIRVDIPPQWLALAPSAPTLSQTKQGSSSAPRIPRSDHMLGNLMDAC